MILFIACDILKAMIEIFLDTIDSTQVYAKAHWKTFDPEGLTCITAEEQTAGRGQFQRSWISPRGAGLYVTFYFTLPARSLQLTSLAQRMAHTVADMMKSLSPEIRWPNDVLIRGKKIAGALCDTVFEGDLVHCFLGVGINVNMRAESLQQIDQPATSLLLETGHPWDRKALLRQLQEAWERALMALRKQDPV